MNVPNKRHQTSTLILLGIIFLSTFLRIKTWSGFLIYPDSYRYLLEAKNQLVGFDKPLFVYLVKIIGLATGNFELSGRLVVFCASLMSIPLLYFTFKKYFGSQIALACSFLLGISFSHVVWSGYILSDTLAIFFYIFSLFLLVEYPLICGLSLFLAALVRPEYILLFIPAVIFYLLERKRKKIVSLLFGFVLSVLFLAISRPDLAPIFVLKSGSLEFVRNFLVGDFLIIVLGVGGIFYLYKKKRSWFWYFLSSLGLLALIYQITSPANWRYGVHLLVGLSLPAGFFISELVKNFSAKSISRLAAVVVLLAAFVQIFFSYQGIGSAHPELSYETLASSKIKAINQLPNLPMLSYYNEAYAWHLNKQVISFNELSCQKEVILIEDQPTRDFSSSELREFKENYSFSELGSFQVNQSYFYKNKVYLEKAPVVLYLAKRKDGEKTRCNNSGLR